MVLLVILRLAMLLVFGSINVQAYPVAGLNGNIYTYSEDVQFSDGQSCSLVVKSSNVANSGYASWNDYNGYWYTYRTFYAQNGTVNTCPLD